VSTKSEERGIDESKYLFFSFTKETPPDKRSLP